MSRIKVKRDQVHKRDKAAIARVRAALRREEASERRSTASRFVWAVCAGLSSLALGLYHPAMAQDEPGRDRQPAPREPERGFGLWSTMSPIKPEPDPPADPLWPGDRDRNVRGTSRLMAQQDLGGPPKQHFEIPSGPLGQALTVFSRQTELQLLYLSELVEGRITPGVQGDYTPEDGLRALLTGTGLQYQFSDAKTVVLHPVSRSEDMSPPAPADLQPEERPVKVPEVVVKEKKELPQPSLDPVSGYRADVSSTITRGALAIRETPNSITVVTKDSLRDRNALTSYEALENVAGVVRSFNNYGIEQFTFRGFGSGQTGLVSSNGLSVPNISALDPALIERYEILKGPASILRGAVSQGADLNRVTKVAEPGTFADLFGMVGSREFRRFSGDVNAPIFGTDRVFGRMVFAYEEGNGFVDRTKENRIAVAPAVRFNLFNSTGTLDLSARLQREGGARTRGIPLLADGTVPTINRRTGVFGTGNAFRRDTDEVFAHWEQPFLRNLTLTAKFQYSRSHLKRQDIYAYSFGGAQTDGTTYVYSGFGDFRRAVYAGELSVRYKGQFNGREQQVVGGVNPSVVDSDIRYGYTNRGTDNLFNPSNTFSVTEGGDADFAHRRTKQKQTGLFGQAILRPIPRFTLVLGGRYDWYNENAQSLLAGTARDSRDSVFTGRAGASYEVLPGVNIYGSFANSFLPQPFLQGRDGNPLQPETAQQWEAGVKADVLDRRLKLTAAYFRIARQNVGRQVALGGIFDTVGEQRHQGLELEAVGELYPGWRLIGSYAFIDAKITEDTDPLLQGKIPRHVPTHSGSLWLRHDVGDQWFNGALQGLHVAGGLVANSSQFLTDVETAEIPGWVRVDLRGGYAFKNGMEVSVFVRNLLDAQFIEAAGQVSGVNQLNAPLTLYAMLAKRF